MKNNSKEQYATKLTQREIRLIKKYQKTCKTAMQIMKELNKF